MSRYCSESNTLEAIREQLEPHPIRPSNYINISSIPELPESIGLSHHYQWFDLHSKVNLTFTGSFSQIRITHTHKHGREIVNRIIFIVKNLMLVRFDMIALSNSDSHTQTLYDTEIGFYILSLSSSFQT